MSIPSYDDLTPPIPDIVSSESVAQLELFLQTLGPGSRDRAMPGSSNAIAPAASVAAPVALYACVQAEGDGGAALLAIARDFSPRVMRAGERDILLDVSGLGRLIGDPATIAAEIDRAVRDAGVRAGVAIAPTQTAARLLCSTGVAGAARPAMPRVVVGDAAAALAPLPIRVLQPLEALPPAMNVRDRARPYTTFESWGIATLGDLAALPAADLASRLGRRGTALQRLARGLEVRPFVPDGDTPRYRARLELEWPIDGLEPLSFMLARLLDPLSGALERADRAAAAVHLTLRLTDRSTHVRVLQLPAPLRDARVLRTLLLLDLESHPPAPLSGAGETGPPSAAARERRSNAAPRGWGDRGPDPGDVMVDAVEVELDPAPARVTQFSLLQRALPSPETLSTLTARLSALVGDSRVGAPALVDTHRPGAFEMCRFAPDTASSGRPIRPGAEVMLRRQRIPPALRVNVERGRPVFLSAARRGMPSGAVTQAAGPWRTSGGWWRAGHLPPEGGSHQTRDHESWNRDEWDVALASGAICRIYQDRSTGRWFFDGIYD